MALIKLGMSGERQCKNGFFQDYLEYTKHQDSPEDFHQWVAVGIIGAALGRKCWKDRGFYKIFPNLYLVLVAESAAFHKSTALGIGTHLLKEAIGESLSFFSQKITPQALINHLSEISEEKGVAEAIVEASEFAVFLGRTNLDPTLLEVLTDFYDCPSQRSYKTMMRGIENINNICLNMLAGTTPEWLKTALPEESLGGGFMSRLVMVNRYELTKEPNAFPEDMLTSLESKEARERCKNDLQLISGMSGPFEWTPQSKNLYQDWFHDENIPDLQTCESFLRGYFGRKGDLIIKLAMIFSAATSPSKVLDQKDIWNAISLLKENEKYLSKVTDYMGRTEVGKNVEKVLGIIKKYQPCPHSRVMQSVSHQMDKNQLRDVIETLLEAGHILRTRTEKGGNLYTIKT